jgi:hypothetical protein
MSHNQTTRLLILIQAILLTAFGLILKSMEDNFGDMLIGSGIAITIVLSIRFCFKSLHSISHKKQVFRIK